MGLRICTTCKEKLPDTKFEQYPTGTWRKKCTPCRMLQKNRKRYENMGGSHEAYLRNLFAKLRSTRRNTHSFSLTAEEVLQQWDLQDGKCAVSGVALTHHLDGSGKKEFNASIDRINNDEGYSRENVRLVAYRINIMRHTLSTDMFWWWVKTIHDYACD